MFDSGCIWECFGGVVIGDTGVASYSSWPICTGSSRPTLSMSQFTILHPLQEDQQWQMIHFFRQRLHPFSAWTFLYYMYFFVPVLTLNFGQHFIYAVSDSYKSIHPNTEVCPSYVSLHTYYTSENKIKAINFIKQIMKILLNNSPFAICFSFVSFTRF